jgi:hypothetical protein
MSRAEAFRNHLRMFRELCENTMRTSGSSPKGLQGVTHLRELEAVFAGERPFRGDLLEPLSAFSNVLVSGRLPASFARLTFGDACSALSEVLASRAREKSMERWRFDPDISKRTAARLALDGTGRGLDRLQREYRSGWEAHARENRRFVLSAMERARGTNLAVVVGGARAYDIPLDDIARRFARVIVVDVCDDVAPRGISTERFDVTGTYNQFVTEVGAIVARSRDESDAERHLDELVSSYDVPATAVRLCGEEVEPDFVVSSMVLTQLGVPFKSFVARAFQDRGFEPKRVAEGPLASSLSALACRVEQHHIAALLRIPKLAVLTSDVSETPVTFDPRGELVHVGASRTQLSVESLLDRLPSDRRPVDEGAWDWLRIVPKRPGAPGASMSVEGLVFEGSD